MPTLPARPAREYLRKEAKRVARDHSLQLAAAQRMVAAGYGFASWAQLMEHVAERSAERRDASALLTAVRAGDVETVRTLLAGGANPQLGDGRESPLHAAARRGPLALVEALIIGGALEWQTDRDGRTPLDVARRGRARDRAAIIALLDRTVITDAAFRAAVDAIHAGDVTTLERLIDAQPRLLHERIVGPDVYRKATRAQYFRDPKLFWFIANNPTLVERLPPNITAIAQLLIDRGIEKADLDYALELTMTSAAARETGQQLALARVLLAAGATATPAAIATTAAHRELDILRALVDSGLPMTAPIAAALGAEDALRATIAGSDPSDIQSAFGLAVINGQLEATRIAIDAGADVRAFLPVHTHSTALHQAAINDDTAMIELLLARGAPLHQRDTLWDGTPLDWAIHEARPAARAMLEQRTSAIS